MGVISVLVSPIFTTKKSYWLSAIVALLFSFSIEVSQLYQADWINAIRHTRLGGLVLGFGFQWTDLVAYSVGIAFGATLDYPLRNGSKESKT